MTQRAQGGQVKFSDIWDVGIGILTFGILAVDVVSLRWEESN